MGTVQQLTQIGFTPNQAKHLGTNGLDLSAGGWTFPSFIGGDNNPVDVSDSFSYASATTFTVPYDLTPLLRRGDRIKWTQPTLGTKYGYIVNTSFGGGLTTITKNDTTDYTVANEAVTDFSFSRLSAPYGFPARFNYSPAFTGFSVNPTGGIYQYWLENLTCFTEVRQPNAGTSNATGFTIGAPITAATITNMVWFAPILNADNNGGALATVAKAQIASAGTAFSLFVDVLSAGWTAANGKRASFSIWYQI